MKPTKKVLFVCQYFFPGFRAGGPQQTVKNIIEVYADKADFFILALNRDLGSNEVYPYESGIWHNYSNVKIMYLPESEYSISTISSAAKDMDIVYACGLFANCSIKAMIAKKMNKFSASLYVAPMGVLFKGAFSQKNTKKSLFVRMAKIAGLFKPVIWSFTSIDEKEAADELIGRIQKYIIAEDLPRKPHTVQRSDKADGVLRIIFLSRICVQKNLSMCLDILNNQWNGKIVFDIYGPIEDAEYWPNCQEKIKQLPMEVECNYCGNVDPKDILNVFAKYHVFLFPTLGENFGHVIYEALAAGCLPIISDQTPWLDLDEKECGAVIHSDTASDYVVLIQKYLDMTNAEFERLSHNAMEYAEEKYSSAVVESDFMVLL